MMRYIFSLLLCLCLTGFALAQENEQTPYEIALQRIEDAEASGASDLDLSSLGLTELPPEIGTLSNLRYLHLSQNQLSSLPIEIGNLSNLYALYLGQNQLSSLPPEIGNLSNLGELDLSSNQLSSLPVGIGNLNSLLWLEVSRNKLSSLPAEIGNLSNLQELHLNSNQLSSLPPEIENLSRLCVLELTANRFESIPLELLSLEGLRTGSDCYYMRLSLDEYLLDTLPEEVAAGGTSAILAYLENEAWWHLQRLIAGGAGSIGLLSAIVLGWRWKNRRGKSKRKNSE